MARNAKIWIGTCAALLLAGSLAARADDEPVKVAGTWKMTMEGRQGRTQEQTLTLEQDGTKIKGSIRGMRGDTPVEGTVDGNKINFTGKRQGPEGEMTFEYTATIDGDSMKGSMTFRDFTRDFTAKRQTDDKGKDKDKDKDKPKDDKYN